MKSFAKAEKAYYNSKGRKSVFPDPARHLVKTEAMMSLPCRLLRTMAMAC